MTTTPDQWVAAVPWSTRDNLLGRLSRIGGTLTVDAEHVRFAPLWRLGRRREVALADLTTVEPFADRPPRLRLVTSDGHATVLMVLPRRSSSSATRDTSARDAAVARIRAALP